MTHLNPLLLIIDDDEMNLEVMTVYLELANYRTITAHSGKQGIQMATQHLPDMILVDARLQDSTGYEVCKQLRLDERTQDKMIIIMTALADKEDEILAEKAGADDFIQKSFNTSAFIKRIEEIMTSPR